MTTKSDKRRSLPRQATAPAAAPLPLPLPFPRPLGSATRTHRRTQSSAPSLPSSSKHHSRSKSWIANLFKPNTNGEIPIQTTTRRKDFGGSLKLFSHSERHKVAHVEDLVYSDKENPPRRKVDEFGNDEVMLTPSLPSPGVYQKPRRPLVPLKNEQEDLAKRLASWDWDGGERLDDDDDEHTFDTTLEITGSSEPNRPRDEELPAEADESLGTVWKGFLAETVSDASQERFLTRALSPTSTSPPLPPVPFPQPDPEDLGETEGGAAEQEISFLSLDAADSSLSTSQFNLSSFPSPSGGEISFTDPFRFANHLLPSPPSRPPRPRLSFTDLRSPSRASSIVPSTTLAERRSKPVPSLRINPHLERDLPRKPSAATSLSVYSRYDDDGSDSDKEESELPPPPSSTMRIETSYFSPISPEQTFSPSSFPLPHDATSSSTFSPVTNRQDLAAQEGGGGGGGRRASRQISPLASSTRSTLSSSSSSSSSSHPRNGGSSTGRRHSLLFEAPLVAPPSSTFDHDEEMEKFKPFTLRGDSPGKSRDDEVVVRDSVDDERSGRRKEVRISGWREDWNFNVTSQLGAERRDGEEGSERDEDEEEEESEVSDGEVEKRISLHGQRELERRALERKERWKEERNCLYGEPVDAEYEFGLAL